MNREQLEQLLLLEQSGELTPPQQLQLNAELTASEQARRLRDQLRTIAAAAANPVARPAPDAAARIAARLQPAARPAFTFVAAWKPALAFAAALALLVGVRTFHAPRSAPVEIAAATTATTAVVAAAATQEETWSDPLDSEFTELESLLASIASENSLETTEL